MKKLKRKTNLAIQEKEDIIARALPIIKRRREVLARVSEFSNYKLHNHAEEDQGDIIALIKSKHIAESFLFKNLSVGKFVTKQVPWVDAIGICLLDPKRIEQNIRFPGRQEINLWASCSNNEERIYGWEKIIEQYIIENP